MAEPNTFQKIIIAIVKFFRNLWEKIKTMDRRKLIIICAAVVLFIIILSVAIHSAKSNKKVEESSTEPPVVYVVPEETTDSALTASVSVGTYKVNTGDNDVPLNVRMAASSDTTALTSIPNGTTVTVLYVDDSDKANNNNYGWGYLEYDGQRGWVSMEYLKAAS